MKRVFFKTYGCQMNVYDSDRMADSLRALGYVRSDRPDGADLIVLNTCHIREKASEKVYSELGRLSVEKRRRAEDGENALSVVVAGCVAQAEGDEIFRRNRDVDVVVGPQALHKLPELLAEAARAADGRGAMALDFAPEPKFDSLPAQTESPHAAFLTIQEGCDKFCSFCVVPYTRGAEASRSAPAIVTEAERLVGLGAREITLLGQNVNAWRGDGPDGRVWTLGRLLRRLAEIPGVARLRYTTSHPNDMDDDLIAAHGDTPALQPFLHLPVQSGSDRVLKAMNRKHDADAYRRIVDRLRAARPDMALSSDFIVGHPGETAADFDATMRLVDEIGFAQAYAFKYSPRPGTPAALQDDQLPDAEKSARLSALLSLLNAQRVAFNKRFEGATTEVLIERRDDRGGRLAGRSAHWQSVYADGPDDAIGRVVTVAIRNAGPNAMNGVVVAPDQDRAAA